MLIKKCDKSSIFRILFALSLALLCISGCLEKSAIPSQQPPLALSDQPVDSILQMDYDVELSRDLFRLQGNLLLPGAANLAYVLLNASLRKERRPILTTKYLLMQIESSREYGFEICKSCRLESGEYDCLLRVEGPQGVIAEGMRKVSLKQSGSGPKGWSPAEEAAFWRMIEENKREENEREEDEREETEENGRGKLDGIKEDVGGENDTEEDGDGGEENQIKKDSIGEGGRETSSSETGSRALFFGYQASDDLDRVSSQEDVLVGSVTSKKYHCPDCRYAQKIKPENLVSFSGLEEARSEDYLPCKVCNP